MDVSWKACSIGVGIKGVWVVTNPFSVQFRTGIDDSDPEGREWVPVSAPSGGSKMLEELLRVSGQIAVNSNGNVWLLAPTGQAYFRKNASVHNPMGSGWQIIKGPPIKSISVGKECVWAVRTDGSVVLRRGITKSRSYVIVAPSATSSLPFQ
jgi:hypothetical protein